MTTLSDRYSDLLDARADPATTRLVADLDALCAESTPPPGLRGTLAETLRAAALAPRQEQATRLHGPRASTLRPWPGHAAATRWSPRLRLGSLLAALLLALGGAATYVNLHGATPVSAQAILRRAAAALPRALPDQVVHQTSLLYFGPRDNFGLYQKSLVTGPVTVSVDQWTQLDATGAISQQVTTLTNGAGSLLARMLQVGRDVRIYYPGDGTIQSMIASHGHSSYWVDQLPGRADPRQFVLAAAQGLIPNTRLLPQQTLDGAPVDVVEMSYPTPVMPGYTVRGGAHTEVLYIDARTYALRDVEENMQTAQGDWEVSLRMRVTGSTVLSLSDAPAGAFALGAPAAARVLPPPYQPLSVAAAVALPGVPAPLLGGDADGLQLQGVTFTHVPEFSGAGYSYQAGTSPLGDLDPHLKSFWVSLGLAHREPGVDESPEMGPSQPLTLTVAGQTVSATYYGAVGGGAYPQGERILTYQQGTVSVWLGGIGLSKDEFFAAVGALADGKSNPALVAQLQHELDAAGA